MFGILKKKLKEAITKVVKKTEEKEEEIIEEEEQKEVEERVKEEVKEEIEGKPEEKEEIEKEEVPEKKEPEQMEAVERKPEKAKEERAGKIEPEQVKAKEKVAEKKPEKEKKKPKVITKISRKISRKIEITEGDIHEILWDIQLALLQGDVALEVAEKIVGDVKEELVGKKIEKSKLEESVKQAFERAMLNVFEEAGEMEFEKLLKSKKPFLIVFLGFNGSGKTTTIAKIGKHLLERGYRVVFAAADTFRAASIEQLEEHGKRLGIHVIKHSYGSDPAAVIFDAMKHAQAKGIDIVLADTAGRSHANVNLIEELKKICRVNKPDLKILVLDSLTGNDIIEQAKMFHDAVGVDALIFTKVDVCEKGGSILSAVHTIKKPVLFLGTGQGYKDITPFDRADFVKRLLE